MMLKDQLAAMGWGHSHQKDWLSDNFPDIEIRKNNRAKRLSLRANVKKRVVELVVPPRVSRSAIQRFVSLNQNWINEKQQSFPDQCNIVDGAKFLFKGKEMLLDIERTANRGTDIHHDNGMMYIKTSRDDVSNNVKRWVIDEAKASLAPLVHQKAQSIRKTVERVDFRDTASRWGSCSSTGRIMLSWRLIMAPDYVFDYVVAHEVAHLKHMDHSKQFWNLCYDLVDPKYDANAARQWLKENGNSLLRFF